MTDKFNVGNNSDIQWQNAKEALKKANPNKKPTNKEILNFIKKEDNNNPEKPIPGFHFEGGKVKPEATMKYAAPHKPTTPATPENLGPTMKYAAPHKPTTPVTPENLGPTMKYAAPHKPTTPVTPENLGPTMKYAAPHKPTTPVTPENLGPTMKYAAPHKPQKD